MNLIDLKERIVISPSFSKEECDFLLTAINAAAAVDTQIEPDGVLITPNDHRIDTLYVWLSVDGKGHEGIMSMQLGDQHFPCIASNKKAALTMAAHVQYAARASGGSREVKLMMFERGEEL